MFPLASPGIFGESGILAPTFVFGRAGVCEEGGCMPSRTGAGEDDVCGLPMLPELGGLDAEDGSGEEIPCGIGCPCGRAYAALSC